MVISVKKLSMNLLKQQSLHLIGEVLDEKDVLIANNNPNKVIQIGDDLTKSSNHLASSVLISKPN